MIRKEEKGSVTLFVLIVCMFMIMVLLMVNIAVMNRNRSQEKELEEIAKEYNQNETDLDNAYAKVTGENDYATVSEITNIIYPVGSIYITTNNQNPGEYLGGEWESFGEGKTLVGVDSNDSDFSTVEKTGGSKTNTHNHFTGLSFDGNSLFALLTDEMPRSKVGKGLTATAIMHGTEVKQYRQDSTENETISIMQPYIVTYMWKRIN